MMQKLFSHSPIATILKEQIKQFDTVFVFPTQTSANEWADYAVKITEAEAVATERFIAWDDFKSSSIKSVQQTKKSIPATVRTMFASALIKENKEKKFFSYIIAKEFAQDAEGFTSWISGILPSLSQWKERFLKMRLSPDAEDEDYLILYEAYKKFLETHNVFDPAWESPPFNSSGKKYVVFFPEILMDYVEYKEILESSQDITLIHLQLNDFEEQKPRCYFFSNARTELRYVALHLKWLHQEQGIPYEQMAISVPDIETYTPYLSRELSLYEIPHVQSSGKIITACTAGSFFVQALNCVQENFSYNSIKTLLMNEALPWDDKKLHEAFIEFGKENNCICSYQKGNTFFDVWKESFKRPVETTADERLKELYSALKNIVTAMVNATSFKEIRKAYFTFKNHFFNSAQWLTESDMIISRCITELSALIDLEEEFPDCAVSSPYQFFVTYLSSKMYVPQTEENGVHIFPYRVAASAPFLCHYVIDASQAATAVVYKQLSFLTDKKREQLGFTDDPNVTAHFFKSYSESSGHTVFFSASEKTFTGYALTNSALKEIDCRKNLPSELCDEVLLKNDFYGNEKKYFSMDYTASGAETISQYEKRGFAFWKSAQEKNGVISEAARKKLNDRIDAALCKEGKVSISYSTLYAFYSDPHTFMLERVLGIEERNSEAELIDRYAMGNLYHSILEFYCRTVKQKNLLLEAPSSEGLSAAHTEILLESIDEAIRCFKVSALANELIHASKEALTQTIFKTVERFCTKFNGYEVDSVETKYVYAPEGKPYFFNGRIDCLLKNGDLGEYVLVDFKSSASAIHADRFFVSDRVSVPDFQMPMYVHLLKNQPKEKKKIVSNCAFFNVKDGLLVPVVGSLVDSKEENEIFFEETQKRFLLLAEYYAQCVLNHSIDVEGIETQWQEAV